MKLILVGKQFYRQVKFRKLLLSKAQIDTIEAKKTLLKFYPRDRPAFHQKNELDLKYDVMIIIPVHNVFVYLEKCIYSVLNQQTRYSFQAVFVDDGSTDDSGDILDKWITSPHVVIHTENHGLPAARNRGLQRITGRYVVFLDSDDYLAEDAVEKLVSSADRNHADIVEGGFADFDGKKLQI